ncbi:MAG: glycosyltransferase family 4 protein [Candidatus Peribacteraceae bacterium]|nr:glycosyltransferase family 4 protein [Candidatus Peribacteraceae bacterium]
MFGWEYPPIHLGGLGVACQGLVRGLLRNGIDISLVLPHPNPQAAQELDIIAPTPEELERIIVTSNLKPYDSVEEYAHRIRAIESHEENQIYGEDLAQEIENYTAMSIDLTKNVEADVIHCHDWMTYEAGIRASAHHKKPLVAHIHATELDRTHFHPNPWIYEKEKRGFLHADNIIAVSNYTKEILTGHYGINPNKITVVHNGNNKTTAELGGALRTEYRQKRGPMILFLGRLTVQKGPNQFLDMAAQVHKYRPDVHFVMAGDGHMLGELIHKTHALGLQDNVIFAGKVSNTEAQKLFAQAECFVMPSLSEPFGLVALEAVAEGTPVVLSNQSGVGEVMNHALKVDFWDTAKMADCVLTILRENVLGSQLRSEASHILKTLTWENQAKQVRSLYHKILDRC